MKKLSFEDMNGWTMTQLTKERDVQRKKLTHEIQKRDQLKGEILFLQESIETMREE